MIPFIRSLSELMAITNSRENRNKLSKDYSIHKSLVKRDQRKDYLRSPNRKEINLPNFPKTIKSKWRKNKEYVTRFINDLDYNNQIQSSYDLTLLERQNKINQQDVA